jgi:hypothetical protein
MTNTDSKTEIIDAILKNRQIIKNRIHLKQFKEHLTKEEIKKLQKPITDKLDNITEFASLMMNEANPKNVLAIEEEDWQAQSRGKASLKGTTAPQAEDKNVSKKNRIIYYHYRNHLQRPPQ